MIHASLLESADTAIALDQAMANLKPAVPRCSWSWQPVML